MSRQFAKAVEELWRTMFDPYRLGLNYMRGPGPKWRATLLSRNGPGKNDSLVAFALYERV